MNLLQANGKSNGETLHHMMAGHHKSRSYGFSIVSGVIDTIPVSQERCNQYVTLRTSHTQFCHRLPSLGYTPSAMLNRVSHEDGSRHRKYRRDW